MKPIAWYNIPEKPDTIIGPATVFPSQSGVKYKVDEIDNATSYHWILSTGISGSSYLSEIELRFDDHFQTGKISVIAVNDGFGESEPVELKVISNNSTFIPENKIETKFEILQNQKSIIINVNSDRTQNARIKIYDGLGKVILNDEFFLNSGFNSKTIDKNLHFKGLAIVELLTDNEWITKKTVIF
jgi:hypothetical protein